MGFSGSMWKHLEIISLRLTWRTQSQITHFALLWLQINNFKRLRLSHHIYVTKTRDKTHVLLVCTAEWVLGLSIAEANINSAFPKVSRQFRQSRHIWLCFLSPLKTIKKLNDFQRCWSHSESKTQLCNSYWEEMNTQLAETRTPSHDSKSFW